MTLLSKQREYCIIKDFIVRFDVTVYYIVSYNIIYYNITNNNMIIIKYYYFQNDSWHKKGHTIGRDHCMVLLLITWIVGS